MQLPVIARVAIAAALVFLFGLLWLWGQAVAWLIQTWGYWVVPIGVALCLGWAYWYDRRWPPSEQEDAGQEHSAPPENRIE